MTKRNPDIGLDDLESEFDYGSEAETSQKKRQKDVLFQKEYPGTVQPPKRSESKGIFHEEYSRLERQKNRLMTLDVYSRHKELINQYFLYYPGATKRLQRDTTNDRTDYDVLRDTHRFLWDEKELSEAAGKSWEARLAKRYYDKLFKEYCIVDLSQYKKNRIAMRWRIEKEVRSGKGQFVCGDKRCESKEDLTSWEVNFGYIENGEKKNALVKLRLCPECSAKLNFHSQKRKAKGPKKEKKVAKQSRSLSETRDHEEHHVDSQPSTSSQGLENDKRDDDEGAALEEEQEKAKIKKEAEKMAQIWKKRQEPLDPEKVVEAELDEFLEDMFI